MMKHQSAQTGFTLLELMIALSVMGVLVALSAQSIRQALVSKIKIQQQTDEMSSVRDALKVIETDVNLGFHYQDLEMELRNAVKKSSTAPAAPGTPGAPAPGANPNTQAQTDAAANTQLSADDAARKANRVDPATQFVGTGDEMNFITLNSGRVTEGQSQGDEVKVGYSVKSCNRVGGKQESTKCLMRRSDANIDGDVTKGGSEVVLLENVSEFKLRYFGKGRQDWTDAWNSIEGDATAKGKYPAAVEISLTIENGDTTKKRKISMQLVAQVRFVNNPTADANGVTTTTNADGTTNTTKSTGGSDTEGAPNGGGF